jgi:outer membrane protein OmpA-like peptidoglycan-associated protein
VIPVVKKQKDPVLYYEMNIDTLDNLKLQIIDSIGEYLKKNPYVKVKVIGIGDPQEIDYKNELNSVAYKRSLNVANYLINQLKIDPNRILLVEEIIGPALGVDHEKFIKPKEQEYRSVHFVFEN